jgi:hypothetical protein
MKFLFVFTFFLSFNSSFCQDASVFEGYIANLKIHVELTLHNDVLKGWYQYTNRSEKLNLEGKLSNGEVISLTETNQKGILTGFFEAQLVSSSEIEGTWKNATKTKTLPFNAHLENNVSLLDNSKNPVIVSIDTAEVNSIVRAWSNAHNTHDLSKFADLYADEVLYYCKLYSKDQCIKSKFKLLESGSDFKQRISSPITITAYKGGIVKCDFTKEVKYKGETKNYPAYLLLKQKGDAYLITGESDRITDSNLNFKPDIGSPIDYSIAGSETDEEFNSTPIIIVVVLILMILIIVIVRKKSKSRTNIKEVHHHTEIHHYHHYKEPTIADDVDENVKKGYEFEKYMVDLFPEQYYKIKNWAPDKITDNNKYAESTLHPDLLIEFFNDKQDVRIQFAVECKYRSDFINDKITIEDRQLNNYRKFGIENDVDVFMAIGVGGNPKNPKNLFVIPLYEISNSNIYSDQLFNHVCSPKKGYLYYNYIHKSIT